MKCCISGKLPVTSTFRFMDHTRKNQAVENLTVIFWNLVMKRKGRILATKSECLVQVCTPDWLTPSILLQLFSQLLGVLYTFPGNIFPKKNV